MKAQKWQRYMYGRKVMEEEVFPVFEFLSLYETERIKNCGHYIYAIQCQSCNTKHFAGFNSCDNRWCIPCSHKKVLCWIARLLPIFQNWLSQGNYLSMLNFTIKDSNDLEKNLCLLESSFRELYNSNKIRRDLWKNRFPGGLRSLEIKLGKNSKMWHPHLHCIVMQQSTCFLKDIDWLIPEWEQITYSFSGGNLDYKSLSRKEQIKIKVGSAWIKKVTAFNPNDILKAIIETVKYILKPDTNLYQNEKLFYEAYSVLKGKRQINTWGLLRNLKKEVEEDYKNLEDKALTDFICQRCDCTKGKLISLIYNGLEEDFVLYDLSKKEDIVMSTISCEKN